MRQDVASHASIDGCSVGTGAMMSRNSLTDPLETLLGIPDRAHFPQQNKILVEGRHRLRAQLQLGGQVRR